MRLLNKRIVYIFGASGGIGSQIAKKAENEGARTTLFYRNRNKMLSIIKEKKLSPNYIFGFDIKNKKTVYRTINKAMNLSKGVHVAFYCIGIGQNELLLRHSDRIWVETLEANLTGAYLIIKSVIPKMIKNHYGKIIIISSRYGKMGLSGLSAYSASKHGLTGLVKCAALELARYNITVNAICPARVDTPLTDRTAENLSKVLKKDKAYILEKFRRENAINRLIKPSEVADLALFLSSDKAQAITGEIIGLTGGISYIYE